MLILSFSFGIFMLPFFDFSDNRQYMLIRVSHIRISNRQIMLFRNKKKFHVASVAYKN